MKILSTSTTIETWDKTGELTGSLLKDGEKQNFIFIPNNPLEIPIFLITGIIHFTEPDSNFLLDIIIKSQIDLELDKERATVQELYDAYCEIRKEWRLNILRKSIAEGFTLVRDSPPTPFYVIEPLLNQVLFDSYPL